VIRLFAYYMVLVGFTTVPLKAQQRGLLVVAHGADSGWNAGVRAVVSQVEWQGPIEVAFLMGSEAATASWNTALTRLQARAIDTVVVVPLMVSSHGAHTRQIRHYAGELAELPADLVGHSHGQMLKPRVPVRVTGALDGSPELGEILLSRWQEREAARAPGGAGGAWPQLGCGCPGVGASVVRGQRRTHGCARGPTASCRAAA
jgi:sirohydrochlorin ferrochelatase